MCFVQGRERNEEHLGHHGLVLVGVDDLNGQVEDIEEVSAERKKSNEA
jgi:hypothetical protein